MANKILGEVEVKILDQTYTLRPEFEGIMLIESHSGKKVAQLVNDFIFKRITLKDIAAIVYGGAVGKEPELAKDPDKFREIGNQVMHHGYQSAALLNACSRFACAVFTGKPIDDIEEYFEEKKKEEPKAVAAEEAKPIEDLGRKK